MKLIIVFNTKTKDIIFTGWLNADTRPAFTSPDLLMAEFDTQAEADKFIADNNLVGQDEMGDGETLHGYEHITDRDELKAWITGNGLADYFDLRKSVESLKAALDEYFGV